jgi:hypothetical protein
MTVAHNASLKHITVTLTGGNWTKVLDEDHTRTYLMIQNNEDAHQITVGFGTNTVAPTTGFLIDGATSNHKTTEVTFEFGVAPINAIWAKTVDTHDHPIHVVYDD